MKTLTMAALMAAQWVTAVPSARAADLADGRTHQAGAFAGLRVRMPLDGDAGQRQLRAGLALAPTMHSRSADGASRMRIGEGLELGLAGDRRAQLSLGGTPVSRLAQGPVGPNGRRLNASTGQWVAIGVGGVVVLLGVAYLVFTEMMECDADEECS